MGNSIAEYQAQIAELRLKYDRSRSNSERAKLDSDIKALIVKINDLKTEKAKVPVLQKDNPCRIDHTDASVKEGFICGDGSFFAQI